MTVNVLPSMAEMFRQLDHALPEGMEVRLPCELDALDEFWEGELNFWIEGISTWDVSFYPPWDYADAFHMTTPRHHALGEVEVLRFSIRVRGYWQHSVTKALEAARGERIYGDETTLSSIEQEELENLLAALAAMEFYFYPVSGVSEIYHFPGFREYTWTEEARALFAGAGFEEQNYHRRWFSHWKHMASGSELGVFRLLGYHTGLVTSSYARAATPEEARRALDAERKFVDAWELVERAIITRDDLLVPDLIAGRD